MDDEIFDEFLSGQMAKVYQEMKEENDKSHIANMQRLKEMEKAYALFSMIAKDSNMTIEFEQGKDYKSIGNIYLKGKELNLKHCQAFVDACKLSDGMDMYPMLDGTLKISITFHRIAVPIM